MSNSPYSSLEHMAHLIASTTKLSIKGNYATATLMGKPSLFSYGVLTSIYDPSTDQFWVSKDDHTPTTLRHIARFKASIENTKGVQA